MNKYRYAALLIGTAFSIIFLIDAVFDPPSFRHSAGLDYLILGCGPLSMIIATVLGWFARTRVAGWWLLVGGVLTAVLFATRFVPLIVDSPVNNFAALFIVLAVFALPMIVCGGLLLRYAALRGSTDRFHNLTPFTH